MQGPRCRRMPYCGLFKYCCYCILFMSCLLLYVMHRNAKGIFKNQKCDLGVMTSFIEGKLTNMKMTTKCSRYYGLTMIKGLTLPSSSIMVGNNGLELCNFDTLWILLNNIRLYNLNS